MSVRVLQLNDLCSKISFKLSIVSRLPKDGGSMELSLVGYDDSFKCARELMRIMSEFSDVGYFTEYLGALTATSLVYFSRVMYRDIDLYPLIQELSEVCKFDIEMDQGANDTIVFNFYLLKVLAENPRAPLIVYDKMLEFANKHGFSCHVEVNTSTGIFIFTLKKRTERQ